MGGKWRWWMFAAAATAVVSGCGPTTLGRPADGEPADEPPAATAAPTFAEIRSAWKWQHPGAVVLEVRAVEGDMAALAGGRTEGLAPELAVRIYRGDAYLGRAEVVEVGPEYTVVRLLEEPAAPIRPGDAAVYLPLP